MIIEIDESKFGKNKYNRSHPVKGVWVFGVVERSQRRKILLIPIIKRHSDSILSILKKYVLKDTIIYSDSWKGYSKLKDYFYLHLMVNHKNHFVDPFTRVHTNTIEGNWSSIKVSVPKRKRTLHDIEIYLVKYMIERNESGSVFKNIIKFLLIYLFI
ncbi:hypothetical protein H312_02460 [Anncaliia algerae PRA339]|uniref:ISXO2-like transposase domain-containing protein n=1 Tax=Anncaliia algerae PRA339 TaxID=1288291 RepID=A0A059EYM8_9MICR|nr:hypothetical protein H312_02460 [Anncaliia algerae PRA339]